MSKEEYKAFMSLLMVNDPWPLGDSERKLLMEFADKQAKDRGYLNWIDAYHNME